MIKYDIENSFIRFLMFKKSKYCRNVLSLYQTTPHNFRWGGLGQIFKSSIKLIKQISIKNAVIVVHSL
jgi:hypothetical protein